jgi:hypothetical protein
MLQLGVEGIQGVFPAIVIGYEVDAAVSEAARALADAPPWMLAVEHQAGGLATLQRSLVGAVCRIQGNLDRALTDATGLLRGLRAMGEDLDEALLARAFPELAGLVLTHGDAYTRAELDRLAAFVGRFLRLPPFDAGHEAIIRCAAGADLLDVFAGWRIFSMTLTPEGESAGLRLVADWVLFQHPGCVRFDDEHSVDAAMIDALRATAARLEIAGEPRAFLLWENSD